MWAIPGREVWVGRQGELRVLQTAMARLAQGFGSVLWLAGEPGIGKSALVTAAAMQAANRDYQVFHAAADELSQQSPLCILLKCLGSGPRTADPLRAEIAQFLRRRPPFFYDNGSTYAAAAEMLVELVDKLCTAAPTVLIIDDAHRMDDASMVVWRRLTANAEQLPLLLIAAYSQDPSRPPVRSVAAGRSHEQVLHLAPLDEDEVSALLEQLIGVPPGSTLTRWAGAAMGNPLHLRELVDVLLRENLIQVIDGHADMSDTGPSRVPPVLTESLSARLNLVPASADVLRTAALLGTEFTVNDLSLLVRRPVLELASGLQSAVAARILTGSGERMAFRHPLIRQALYDRIPLALRRALHLDLAKELAAAEADPLSVAQQLLAAGVIEGQWIPDWLKTSVSALTASAPAVAARLLEMQLDRLPQGDRHRPPLAVALTRALHVMGRWEDVAVRAHEAIAVVTAPDECCEMYWLLVRGLNQNGKIDQAKATLRQALGMPEVPDLWQGRLLAALALIQRASAGALDEADATARSALAAGERSGDAFTTAYALTVLWLTSSVRRDHRAALRHADRALARLAGHSDYPDLEMFALHGRIFSLQNLSRWADAETALRQSRDIGRRAGYGMGAATGVTEAVLLYWCGRWDDALAELASVEEDASSLSYAGLREGGPALLWRGIAALIAVRREEHTADEYLRIAADTPVESVADRENIDFLLIARALRAEQQGNLRLAVSTLSAVLERRPGEMTLAHQWLADLIRMGLAVGDETTVAAALATSRAEAKAESIPGRAAFMRLRCAGLATNDPEPLRAAVRHYRSAGPKVELAATLEDLAVVLAICGEAAECRVIATEAIDLYGRIGAPGDIRRAEARLRRQGVRRGVSGPRAPRPVSGWAALTATERRIAILLAEGRSTPEIATTMFLARRTVQTHISRTLAKLGLRSRVEIAREALRNTDQARDSP